MASVVNSFLKRFFFEHWQRKGISLIAAMVIWAVIHHSMTVVKVIPNIRVHIVNLPPDKAIDGIDGVFNERISLTLTGNKEILDDLSAKDLEVVLDASGNGDEWIASIGKKNLVSLNPEIDLFKAISRVAPFEMIVKQSKRVSEKIPILIGEPVGEAPKGYQFVDVWPYQLALTVNGSESVVKQLKRQGLKISFNLNDISPAELDALQAKHGDEVSFFVPASWKKIAVPLLADTPLEIDDPQAKSLRIDFSRQHLLPLGTSIPVAIFYPQKYSHTLNPETYALTTNDFVVKKNGIKMVTTPLYAQGVSRLFLETVKDRIQIAVIASPKSERENLLWHVQFLYPRELENRYVAKALSEAENGVDEEYLRNRFRHYMDCFRLYTQDGQKLSLKIELQANAISITSKS